MASRDLTDRFTKINSAERLPHNTAETQHICSLEPLETPFTQEQLNCIGDSGLACVDGDDKTYDEDNSIIDLYYCFDLASVYLSQCFCGSK